MSDRTLPSLFNEVNASANDPESQSNLDCSNLQVDCLTVKVYNSSIELTEDAANLAENYLQSLLATQKTVSIVLATGNSQLQFLDCLLTKATIDWSRCLLFHLDEYLGIAAEHPGSFRYYLQTKVVSKINCLQFHGIEGDAAQPLRECSRYGELLQKQPIDLCLLGIGDNGHLAFNEPSVADFNDPDIVKLVKLEETTRQQQVDGGYFSQINDVPNYAYTLTIPTICRAKKIFCLAPGKHKQEVSKKTLNQAISSKFPATILRTLSQTTLFCDRSALT
jgi:glucosamine-6-phosphate deaminase